MISKYMSMTSEHMSSDTTAWKYSGAITEHNTPTSTAKSDGKDYTVMQNKAHRNCKSYLNGRDKYTQRNNRTSDVVLKDR
uniref:Uncharacterized protein n=1 Tax=Parascaris univalens TaxID=6257 RepID=A0A915ASB1_PARUN